MSATFVAKGERTGHSVSIAVAQVVGGGIVTLLAAGPLLLFGYTPGLLVSELALLALISGVGYLTARASGSSRVRSLLYVLGVVALTVGVLWVKGLAH
jgi:hypothetical protein